ncbi:MAG: HEPN domain-containing protein [Isosphaeraceae bacterium]
MAARSLSQREPILMDVAIYHCQQAAEKAVKAFLVFRDRDPDKTHDVDGLLVQAAAFEPALAASRPAGRRLTPYATLYRYPSGGMEPRFEQLNEALDDAASIYDQVLSCLPPEVHPGAEIS